MKSIKMTVVGAAAAALILGAGCRSDSRTDVQRPADIQQDTNAQREAVPATGGSGMDSNVNPVPSTTATAPLDDHAMPNQEANLQKDVDHQAMAHQDMAPQEMAPKKDTVLKDSSIHKHSTLSTRSTSSSVSKKHIPVEEHSSTIVTHEQDDLKMGNSEDLGMGGTGDMAPAPVITPTEPAPVMGSDDSTTAPSEAMPVDNSASNYTGTQDNAIVTPYQKHARLNGSLDNEAGSRTNTTGSNISSNSNPTEPRAKSTSQFPRR